MRIGIDRIKVSRMREVRAKILENSVTLSQFAHNKIVCDAQTTSRLYAHTETTLDEDLDEIRNILRDLGLPNLRGAFVIDEEGHTAVMVYIPR